MDYQESLWQKIFARIYWIAVSNFLWWLGFLIGLGLGGLLPTSIAILKLREDHKDPMRLIRAKIWRDYWQTYRKALANYWKESVICCLILFVILTTLFYTSSANSFLMSFLFYLNTFSLILVCLVLQWYIYLTAHYEEYSRRDRLSNALSYTLGRPAELLVFKVFFWTGMALLWRISPGFIVLAGMGIYWWAHGNFYQALTLGHGFNQLRSYWRRDD